MRDFNLFECRGLDQEHAFLRLLARSEQGTSLILANLLGCHQARLLCKRLMGFLHVADVEPTGNRNQVINGSLGVSTWSLYNWIKAYGTPPAIRQADQDQAARINGWNQNCAALA